MKPIGLLGGTTWVSTQHYYAKLNRAYQDARGGIASAPMLIHSVDFAPIAAAQAAEDWNALGEFFGARARELEVAGAGAIAIGANTLHLCIDAVQNHVDVPVLHIGDGIAQALGRRPTLLLGTAFTMAKPFLRDYLSARGCAIEVPSAEQQAWVHDIIYTELAKERVTQASRGRFQALAEGFQGEQVLLACTELGLVLDADNCSLPLVDSLDCHVQLLLDYLINQL
ncbi:aspartate/glutamate racemase family protein [Litorivicinus lipolyticus]|uniref:aspartate/glutamate racemase family protein n=1 Tax=Litorivicinus lipolyticus TaxID=418701 RepID=UPI003B590A59